MDFSNYKRIKLIDIADIRRLKKNEAVEDNTILLQLSASRGQVDFIEKGQIINTTKYAIIIPKIKLNPRYLYLIICREMEEFCQVYQTGINIQLDELDNLKIDYHEDIKVQDIIVAYDSLYQEEIKREEAAVESLKIFKKSLLTKLFIWEEVVLCWSRMISYIWELDSLLW